MNKARTDNIFHTAQFQQLSLDKVHIILKNIFCANMRFVLRHLLHFLLSCIMPDDLLMLTVAKSSIVESIRWG